MNAWKKAFAAAAREPRRPFDVGAGLRRLAQDADYTPSTPGPASTGAGARRRLGVMARWAVTQSGAAAHLEELSALLGDDESIAQFDGWTNAVDVDGAHAFACMLYLAHHPESARFWWKFAAGAGSTAAAYCLYLDHLGLGEEREAQIWKRQVTASLFEPGPDHTLVDPEEFLEALETVTGYSDRHNTRRTVPTGQLEADFERLTTRHDDGLVCRPAPHLADRIHDLVSQ